MGNVPLKKLVGKGKENKLTKFQRQKLKYDFDTFFGKTLLCCFTLMIQGHQQKFKTEGANY